MDSVVSRKKGNIYIFKPQVKKKFFNKRENRFRAVLVVSKVSAMGHSKFSTYQANVKATWNVSVPEVITLSKKFQLHNQNIGSKDNI